MTGSGSEDNSSNNAVTEVNYRLRECALNSVRRHSDTSAVEHRTILGASLSSRQGYSESKIKEHFIAFLSVQ